MAQIKRTMFAAFRRIAIVVGILLFFGVGLAGTIYLSLRSSEVTVPDVLGKHFLTGQTTLEEARLNIRKRAKRLKPDAKPDTILDQSPRAGDVVKVGQTIAVVVADEHSGKNIKEETPDETTVTFGDKPQENQNTGNAAAQNDNRNSNDNQNRARSNRNTNRNANANANNRNANNQNANNANNRNRNANANRNANNANTNRNTNNANLNRNVNTGANANNRNANNRNTNARNANLNTNRNTNSTRNSNANANRRPPANQATPF